MFVNYIVMNNCKTLFDNIVSQLFIFPFLLFSWHIMKLLLSLFKLEDVVNYLITLKPNLEYNDFNRASAISAAVTNFFLFTMIHWETCKKTNY